METAWIVKVAVSAAPYSIDKPYDYLVPAAMAEGAVPGVRVMVPFGRGNRETEGVILAAGEGQKLPGIKAVSALLDREPVLDADGIALALWMRQRYFCTLFEAVKTILPAGLWYRFREIWRLTDGLDRKKADELAHACKDAGAVLDALFAAGGFLDVEQLRERCGEQAEAVLKALKKAGAVSCETAAKRKLGDKRRRMVELAVSAEDALALVEPRRRSAPMRYEVVKLLAASGRTSAADICYFTGASMQTLRGLEKAGMVSFSEEEELRIPQIEKEAAGAPIVLNEEQQAAFDMIRALARHSTPEAVLCKA